MAFMFVFQELKNKSCSGANVSDNCIFQFIKRRRVKRESNETERRVQQELLGIITMQLRNVKKVGNLEVFSNMCDIFNLQKLVNARPTPLK